jgi:hypothetical protein
MSIINIPFNNTNTYGIELESVSKTEIKQEKFVFILDTSGSMGERIKNSRFSKKAYVSRVFSYLFNKLKREQFGSQETTISLIVFNNQVTPIFRDKSLSHIVENPHEFLRAINNRGGTRTDLAIDHVLDNFDDTYKFVLITDGECNDPTKSFGSSDSSSGDIYLKNYLTQKMEYLKTHSKPVPQFSIMIIGDGPLEASKYMVENYNSTLSYICSKYMFVNGMEYFDEGKFEHAFKQDLMRSIADNSDIKTDINIKCTEKMLVYNSTISIDGVHSEDNQIEPNTDVNLCSSTFGTIRVFINVDNVTPESKFTISYTDSNTVQHCHQLDFSQLTKYDCQNTKHNKLASKFLTILMNKLNTDSDSEEIDKLMEICKLYPESVNDKFVSQLNEFKTMNPKERALRLMSSRTEERSRTPPRSVSPVSVREMSAMSYDVDINGRDTSPVRPRHRTPPRSQPMTPPQGFNIGAFSSPPMSPVFATTPEPVPFTSYFQIPKLLDEPEVLQDSQ